MLCALFRLPTPHIRILLRSSSLPGFGLLLLRVPSLFGISMPLWFSPLCCTCCTPLLIVRGSLSRIAQDSVRLVQSLHDRRRVGRRIHIGVVFANQTLVRGLYDLWLGRVVDLQHCVQVVGVPHLTFAGWGHGGPESVGGRRVSLDGVDHDRSQFVDVMAQFIDTSIDIRYLYLEVGGDIVDAGVQIRVHVVDRASRTNDGRAESSNRQQNRPPVGSIRPPNRTPGNPLWQG